MWPIRMAGWISVSTLTLIFFGLRWLEWFFWVCDFYAAISILSLLIRAGVNAQNRFAVWIENHAPRLIQQLGILMSQTIAVRGLYWVALIVIGYQLHETQDLKNKHHYQDVLIISRYDARHFLLRPARMQPFPATTCADVPDEDWPEGAKLEYLDYQQMPGCKDVAARGAYSCYVDQFGRCKLFPEENADVRLR